MDEMFTLKDANWRGVGMLTQSRMILKGEFGRFDAEVKFGLKMPEAQEHGKDHSGCKCGEVLKGLKPQFCPNFGKVAHH